VNNQTNAQIAKLVKTKQIAKQPGQQSIKHRKITKKKDNQSKE
jgi:hypothetical protein